MTTLRRPTKRDFPSVDHFEVVDVSVGGATDKDVLRDPDTGKRFIAKLGRRFNDLEVMTEYAIYIVGRSIGVSVARARIARFRGKLRFLSEYFLDLDRPEELVHGVQLFQALYDTDSVSEVLGNEIREQEMFSVQAIKAAFGAHYLEFGSAVEDELFSGFVRMLTHDALIGVQDRHHENWGIIVRREVGSPPPRFAPLYDSARGLFGNMPDGHLSPFLSATSPKHLKKYVEKSRPLIGFAGVAPPGGRHFLTHQQLLAAVHRAYPSQRQTIERVIAAYDWRAVRDALSDELGSLCSRKRIQLMLNCLRFRIRSLRRAISGTQGAV